MYHYYSDESRAQEQVEQGEDFLVIIILDEYMRSIQLKQHYSLCHCSVFIESNHFTLLHLLPSLHLLFHLGRYRCSSLWLQFYTFLKAQIDTDPLRSKESTAG